MSNLDHKRIAELHNKVMAFGSKKTVIKPKKVYSKPKMAVFDPIIREKYLSPFKEPKEHTADSIASLINSKESHISYSVLKDIPEEKESDLTMEKIIEELKKGQHLEPKNIKGLPINMADMRWHGGGGLSSVSTDSTLTGNGTPSNPLHVVSSGGLIRLTLTGTVDGAHNSFTATVLPTWIVSDGVWYEQKDYNNGTQWSYTGSAGAYTITTVFYPQSSLYGF